MPAPREQSPQERLSLLKLEHKRLKAQTAAIKVESELGTLVPLENIRRERAKQLAAFRSGMEGLPARIAQYGAVNGEPLMPDQFLELQTAMAQALSMAAETPEGWLEDPGSPIAPRLAKGIRRAKVVPNGHHEQVDLEELRKFAARCVEQRSLEAMAPEMPVKASVWSDEHYVLSNAAVPQPWKPWPFQRDLLDVIAMPSVTPDEISVAKSTRVGVTEVMKVAMAYLLAHAGRHVAMYQPTDDKARKFAQSDVMPMIKSMPVLRDMANSRDEHTGRTGSRAAAQLELNGRMLRLLGAATKANFRQYSTDYALLDECDTYPASVGGEKGDGDPVALAKGRTDSSPFGRVVAASSPTLAGESLIEDQVSAAEAVFHFFFPCPMCGSETRLDFKGDGVSWGMTWDERDENEPLTDRYINSLAATVKYKPECCKEPWGYEKLRPALEEGYWATDDGQLWIDNEDPDKWPALRDAEGEETSWPASVSFRIWRAYNLDRNWSRIVRDYYKSLDNPAAYQVWHNNVLGQSYRNAENEVAEGLEGRREEESWVPPDMRIVVAATDVQKDRLSTLVVGFGPEWNTYVLERREDWGPTDDLGGAAWQSWASWIQSSPRYATGAPEEKEHGSVRVNTVVVDSAYNTQTVYGGCSTREFKSWTRRVPLRGTPSPRSYLVPDVKQMPVGGRARKGGPRIPVLMLNTNVVKDRLVERINAGHDAGGESERKVFFSHLIGPDVFDELTSEYKKLVQSRWGVPLGRWVKKHGSNATEAIDCLTYATAMLEYLNYDWLSSLKRRKRKKAAKE